MARARVVHDSAGVAVKMIGITVDITERKHDAETLKAKAIELERFNSLMIGRELKMIDLKREINALLVQSGSQVKYIIHE